MINPTLILVLVMIVMIPVMVIVNLYSWLKREDTRRKRFGILVMNFIMFILYTAWLLFKVHSHKDIEEEGDDDWEEIGWLILWLLITELHGLVMLIVMLVNLRSDRCQPTNQIPPANEMSNDDLA